jgi:hypothetical protein
MAGAIEADETIRQGLLGETDMAIRTALIRAGIVGLGAALLAGCSPSPLPNTPEAVDAAYGIPAGSVPALDRRPDGLLRNGLLPAQSNG